VINAPRTLGGAGAERLEAHLAQVRGGSRPVVLDLSRTDAVDDAAIAVLREAWRELGDRLRVVAAPGSEPAKGLRTAGLRRFAIHSSLSGALTQASAEA
jgi:anti-anti-sigma regulatory factor